MVICASLVHNSTAAKCNTYFFFFFWGGGGGEVPSNYIAHLATVLMHSCSTVIELPPHFSIA